MLDRLTRDLDLEPTQQAEVSEVLATQPTPPPIPAAEREPSDESKLARFEADALAARTRPAGPAVLDSQPREVNAEIANEATLLQTLLPLLKPDQRDRLATRIEALGTSTHEDLQASR